MALHTAEDTRRIENVAASMADRAEDAHQWLLGAHEALLDATRARLAARGHEGSSERIARHLDFIQAALHLGAPEMFTNYVLWDVTRGHGADRPRKMRQELRAMAEAIDAQPDDEAKGNSRARRVATALVDTARAVAAAPGGWHEALIHPGPPSEAARRLADALIAGDRGTAVDLFRHAATDAASPVAALDTILAPAMRIIGERWHAGVITPADEHAATALAMHLVAVVRDVRIDRPSAKGHVLVACPAGNRHVLGAELVATGFEELGWRADLLGADVPTEDLLARVRARRPQLVALSLAMPRDLVSALAVAEGVERLPAQDRPVVMFGGVLLDRYPEAVGVLRGGIVAKSAREALRLLDARDAPLDEPSA